MTSQMRKSNTITVIQVAVLGLLIAIFWPKKAVYFELQAYPDGESNEWLLEGNKHPVWQGVQWQLPSKDMDLSSCPPDILAHSTILRAYYCYYQGRYVNAFGKSVRGETWGLSSEHRFLIIEHNNDILAIEYKLMPNKSKNLKRYATLPDSSDSSILSFLSKIHRQTNNTKVRTSSVGPDS